MHEAISSARDKEHAVNNLLKTYQNSAEDLFSIINKEVDSLCGEILSEKNNMDKDLLKLQNNLLTQYKINLIKQISETLLHNDPGLFLYVGFEQMVKVIKNSVINEKPGIALRGDRGGWKRFDNYYKLMGREIPTNDYQGYGWDGFSRYDQYRDKILNLRKHYSTLNNKPVLSVNLISDPENWPWAEKIVDEWNSKIKNDPQIRELLGEEAMSDVE
ncbi:MAG: hypothetical protein HQL26_07970 [Candidatus Omnitrophica bacterium]|nr:hypothetical protein [Candidatus Omnitrophota bacterium]